MNVDTYIAALPSMYRGIGLTDSSMRYRQMTLPHSYDCHDDPAIVTSAVPPQVFSKSVLSMSDVVTIGMASTQICLEK